MPLALTRVMIESMHSVTDHRKQKGFKSLRPAFARMAVVLSFLAACLQWILCREPVYHSPISHIEYSGKAAGIVPITMTLQALSLALLILAWNAELAYVYWLLCVILFWISWFAIQPTFYS